MGVASSWSERIAAATAGSLAAATQHQRIHRAALLTTMPRTDTSGRTCTDTSGRTPTPATGRTIIYVACDVINGTAYVADAVRPM
jgi:hypothetical protein